MEFLEKHLQRLKLKYVDYPFLLDLLDLLLQSHRHHLGLMDRFLEMDQYDYVHR